jgi:hypothetical protein
LDYFSHDTYVLALVRSFGENTKDTVVLHSGFRQPNGTNPDPNQSCLRGKKDMSSTRGDILVQWCTRGGKRERSFKRLVCYRGWYCQDKISWRLQQVSRTHKSPAQLLSLSVLSLSLSVSREAVLFKSQKLENTCPENLGNP